MITKSQPSSNTLSESAFQKLSRDVRKIVDSAESSASSEKLSAYWKIGERIAREKLEAQVRASASKVDRFRSLAS